MENALLIGLSRQVALQRELDVIANNVANIGTAGFKSRSLRFSEYMMDQAKFDAFDKPDQPLSYVVDKGSGLDMTSGTIEATGNPLNAAIVGNGLFVVNTAQGERYTRNGSFQLDSTGRLVTSEGQAVMGDGGPISFSPSETDIAIGQDGTISTSAGPKGKLRIVAVNDPKALQSEGSSLIKTDAPLPPAGATVRVQGGAVEHSNVRPVIEMSRLIEVNRAYANIAGMLQRSDDLRRSAVEKLAGLT
jgi:flagellar basal-body rod protein FlgF